MAGRVRVEESPVYKGAATGATPFRRSTAVAWPPWVNLRVSPGQQRTARPNIPGVNARPRELDDGNQPTWEGSMLLAPNSIVPFLLSCGHQVVSGYPKQGNGTNEVQTLTPGGTITGGTWTITFGSETTGAIPAAATASQIRAFLERLGAFRPGDIQVAGGPITTGAVTLTFTGKYAATNPAQVTVTTGSLTGTTPTLTPSTTTAGAVGSNTDSLGNGATAGAYIWELESRRGVVGARASQVPVTMTIDDVDYGDPWLFATGAVTTQLGFGQDGTVSVSGPALYVQRELADPALTPVVESDTIRTLLFSDLTVSGWGGGSTCDISGFTWSVEAAASAQPNVCVVSGWPGRARIDAKFTGLSGSVESSLFDASTWDSMLAASTFQTVANYRTNSLIGSSGTPYRLSLSMPATQLGADGGPEAMEGKLGHGATWPWMAVYSTSAGYQHRIIVVNAVSAVETYV